MRDTWRAFRTSLVGIVISAGLLTSWLALPQTAAACSCADPTLVALSTSPGAVVFSGVVGVSDPVGLQVVIDRWFHGRGAAPLVHLDPGYLDNDSAGCGIPAPAAGTRWLFGGTREEGSDLISINLCSPHGDLATPAGQALLAEAVSAFPAVIVPQPSGGAPTPPPAASGASEPWATIGGVAPFLAVGVSGIVVAGLIVLLVAVARRRRSAG